MTSTVTKPDNRQKTGGHLAEAGRATRFKPGHCPNPGGRPKKTILSEAYKAMLEKEVPGDPEGRTYAEAIADATGREAINGKHQAAAEIADRTEGRPAQAVAVTSKNEWSMKYDNYTPEETDRRIKELLGVQEIPSDAEIRELLDRQGATSSNEKGDQ